MFRLPRQPLPLQAVTALDQGAANLRGALFVASGWRGGLKRRPGEALASACSMPGNMLSRIRKQIDFMAVCRRFPAGLSVSVVWGKESSGVLRCFFPRQNDPRVAANVKAADWALSADDLAEIDKIAA